MHKKRDKKMNFTRAALSFALTAAVVFSGILLFEAQPQILLIFGCLIAGAVAAVSGYRWQEIEAGILSGIEKSLEAVLILFLIGIMVGVWILSGTIPTMIVYGLNILSAHYFLATAALLCGLISFVLGAWGTVGTIGLALIGIGSALGIPPALTAGSIISGAYLGEVVSPLSDATNLTAAVIGCDVFSLVRKTAPAAITAFALAVILYLTRPCTEGSITQTAELLQGLRQSFRISPLTLLPLLLMAVCIAVKLPAILSMLSGILCALLCAFFLQKNGVALILSVCMNGFVSDSGMMLLDTLLSAGGLHSMLDTCATTMIAMGFGGLMRSTGQMTALTAPIIRHPKSSAALCSFTSLLCIVMNTVLPDQYLGISIPGEMLMAEYEKRSLSVQKLGQSLLCGGAVSSPLIPWNTCGIYCCGLLGVSASAYLPHAYFSLIMPVLYLLLVSCREKSPKSIKLPK